MKKKAGVVAGIARSGGARDNSVGKDHAHEHGEVRSPPTRYLNLPVQLLCSHFLSPPTFSLLNIAFYVVLLFAHRPLLAAL